MYIVKLFMGPVVGWASSQNPAVSTNKFTTAQDQVGVNATKVHRGHLRVSAN